MFVVLKDAAGRKRAQGLLDGDSKEGAWTYFNEHGRRRAVLEHQRGVLHGREARYHAFDDSLRGEGLVVAGLREDPAAAAALARLEGWLHAPGAASAPADLGAFVAGLLPPNRSKAGRDP